jgi:YcxB-like protein
MDMTPIQFTLTRADWVAAQRANFINNCLVATIWTAFISLLISLISTASLRTTTDDNFLVQFATIACVTCGYIILIQVLTAILGYPRYAKKAFNDNCSLAENTTVLWEGKMINFDCKSHKSAIPFEHFSKVLSNNRVCLLYRGHNLFHIIPANAFASQEQQEQLVTAIRAAKS